MQLMPNRYTAEEYMNDTEPHAAEYMEDFGQFLIDSEGEAAALANALGAPLPADGRYHELVWTYIIPPLG